MVHDAPIADSISVRQLLRAPILKSGVLLAGAEGLGLGVTGVQITPSVRSAFPIAEGVALIVDGSHISTDTYYLDLVLRWASEAGAAMVIVTSPRLEIRLAPRRLANRLGLPLAEVDGDMLLVADELRDLLAEPERNIARMVVRAVNSLSKLGPRDGVEEVLAVIDSVLESSSSLVGTDGGVSTGHPLGRQLTRNERIPVFTLRVENHVARAVQPIVLAVGEEPSFWLVTERQSPTAFWRRASATVLELASKYLIVGLVSERLAQERDARFRLGVLNTIIASDGADSALVHQIGVVGWKVEGWCSAVHVRMTGEGDEMRVLARTGALRAALVQSDIAGALIERADGWTFWTYEDREPMTGPLGELTTRMRRAMANFAAGYEGMRLATGIGRPGYGLAGLRRSLAEAQEAATLAQAAGGISVVQHFDELGVERILLGWYSSKEFTEFAEVMLRPITDIDTDGELLRTLEMYLDAESSPTVTADLLGLHRNTVMNRLVRIRELLLVDLDDADQRLALQLACRTVKLGRR